MIDASFSLMVKISTTCLATQAHTQRMHVQEIHMILVLVLMEIHTMRNLAIPGMEIHMIQTTMSIVVKIPDSVLVPSDRSLSSFFDSQLTNGTGTF
jgi:hypothetical protein